MRIKDKARLRAVLLKKHELCDGYDNIVFWGDGSWEIIDPDALAYKDYALRVNVMDLLDRLNTYRATQWVSIDKAIELVLCDIEESF